MLEIKKEYKDKCIVYEFIGSIDNKGLEKVETMLREDINHTYMFIFNFKYLNHISTEAVKMLQKIYIMSVNYACEIVISGLNTQPAMMLEIFQIDKLYNVQEPVNNVYGEEHESLYYA